MENLTKNQEILNIISDIEELEEYVERLILANKISYDEEFHREVLKKYSDVMGRIRDAKISEDWYYTLHESVFDIFISNL